MLVGGPGQEVDVDRNDSHCLVCNYLCLLICPLISCGDRGGCEGRGASGSAAAVDSNRWFGLYWMTGVFVFPLCVFVDVSVWIMENIICLTLI